jgi:hypothetical protein
MSTYTRLIYVPADDEEQLAGLSRSEVASLAVDERDLEESYAELLDDLHGPVRLIGLDYDAATTLRAVDPIAYRCGFADYLASTVLEVDLDIFPEVVTADLPDDVCEGVA